MTDLPQWLQDELPEAIEPHRFALGEADDYRVISPQGEETVFPSLRDAHSYLSENRFDFIIDDDVWVHEGQDPDSFGLSYPAGKHFVGMMSSFTDENRLHLLQWAYEASLQAAEAWANEPSFYTAYHFIDMHPAFWTRDHGDWHWTTNGHCGRVSQMVRQHGGQIAVELETGCHVDVDDGRPAYTSHYHDYRFDVEAPTFEEAYEALAVELDRFYFPDGTARPEPFHERPRWYTDVLELSEQVRAWKDE